MFLSLLLEFLSNFLSIYVYIYLNIMNEYNVVAHDVWLFQLWIVTNVAYSVELYSLISVL